MNGDALMAIRSILATENQADVRRQHAAVGVHERACAPAELPLVTSERPLSGIRVLDLSRVIAAPVAGRMLPGAPAADAPVTLPDGRSAWLLRQLGQGFTALIAVDSVTTADLSIVNEASVALIPLKLLRVSRDAHDTKADLIDSHGVITERYDLSPGSVVLLRPDQHVCGRWRTVDPIALRHAIQRALAHAMEGVECR